MEEIEEFAHILRHLIMLRWIFSRNFSRLNYHPCLLKRRHINNPYIWVLLKIFVLKILSFPSKMIGNIISTFYLSKIVSFKIAYRTTHLTEFSLFRNNNDFIIILIKVYFEHGFKKYTSRQNIHPYVVVQMTAFKTSDHYFKTAYFYSKFKYWT